jgi:hypothetical protein
MTNPKNDQRFNETLKRMLESPPKQNEDLKLKNQPEKKKRRTGREEG